VDGNQQIISRGLHFRAGEDVFGITRTPEKIFLTAMFKGRAPATHEARRILRAQIGAALDRLKSSQVTDEDIHVARKSIKRARATLRLLRHALPKSTYRHGNATLRDSARPLSAVRDAKVLVDALDQLSELEPDAIKPKSAEPLRRALVRERSNMRQRARSKTDGLALARGGLETVRSRAAHWRVGDQDWSVLGKGLQRVYSKARQLLASAERAPTAECLHEWRKQVKYLWYQVALLEPLGAGWINELADQLHTLSDYLGDDHDLAVLRERATSHGHTFGKPEQRAALVSAIDHKRTGLQQKALVLGARIFQDKPADFAARFARDWRNWKASRSELTDTRRPESRRARHTDRHVP
jgi:CHAD domain-containing protein